MGNLFGYDRLSLANRGPHAFPSGDTAIERTGTGSMLQQIFA